jgi:hypothetical protein
VFRAALDLWEDNEKTVYAWRDRAEVTLIEPSPSKRKVLIALCRPLHEGTSAAPASNEQIAEETGQSEDAVKSKLRELYAVYGLDELPQNKKRAHLAATVLGSGLLKPDDL